MTDATLTGGCLCGAIRYEAAADALFTVVCHCRMCQQWTGSTMFGSVAFARRAVTFTKGTPRTHTSSSICDRGFCSECGSSLYTQYASGGVFDRVILHWTRYLG